MLIHQAEKLSNNDIVYDVLQRKYAIIGYGVSYNDGKLDRVYFDIQNIENGLKSIKVDYQYLYTSLDELSDPDIEFYHFVSNKTHHILPVYLMPLDQLNSLLEYFNGGFMRGFQKRKEFMQDDFK